MPVTASSPLEMASAKPPCKNTSRLLILTGKMLWAYALSAIIPITPFLSLKQHTLIHRCLFQTWRGFKVKTPRNKCGAVKQQSLVSGRKKLEWKRSHTWVWSDHGHSTWHYICHQPPGQSTLQTQDRPIWWLLNMWSVTELDMRTALVLSGHSLLLWESCRLGLCSGPWQQEVHLWILLQSREWHNVVVL